MRAVHKFPQNPLSSVFCLSLLVAMCMFSCEKQETDDLQEEVLVEEIAETITGSDAIFDLTQGLETGERVEEASLDSPVEAGTVEIMDNNLVVFHADSSDHHPDFREILIRIRIRTHLRKIVRTIRVKIWREIHRPCANVFRPDFAKAIAGEATMIDVLANDKIRQCIGEDVKIEKLEVVRGPLFGKAGFTGDDKLEYAAPPNFRGIDLLVYCVKLSNGRVGHALVTVKVIGDGDSCRIKIRNDFAKAEPGERTKIDVLSNDKIRACVGDDVKIESLEVLRGPVHGVASFNDGGALIYAAPDNFIGHDMLVYRVKLSDGQEGKALVTIRVGGNDLCGIILLPDTAKAESGKLTKIDVLANDKIRDCVTDANVKIEKIEVLNGPEHGKAEFTSDGVLVYVSRDGFEGRDFLTYGVKLSNGRKARTLVAIGVSK